MPEEPTPQPSGRPRGFLTIVALALALTAAAISISLILHNRAAIRGVEHTGAVPSPTAAAPASAANTPAPSAAKAPPAGKRKDPLPVLVPGSPLNDERFVALSAEIVIAAMGLKRDADWEINVLAYMLKVLEKNQITVEQYNAYAKALYAQPDRGRAVAENIVTRVEQKTGTKMAMDKLPMFKFDEKTVKQVEKKLLK